MIAQPSENCTGQNIVHLVDLLLLNDIVHIVRVHDLDLDTISNRLNRLLSFLRQMLYSIFCPSLIRHFLFLRQIYLSFVLIVYYSALIRFLSIRIAHEFSVSIGLFRSTYCYGENEKAEEQRILHSLYGLFIFIRLGKLGFIITNQCLSCTYHQSAHILLCTSLQVPKIVHYLLKHFP